MAQALEVGSSVVVWHSGVPKRGMVVFVAAVYCTLQVPLANGSTKLITRQISEVSR